MTNYRNRSAEESLRELLSAFPVVGLTGPRQSGKSTLLQYLLPDYEYVTFDDIRKISLFEDDPMGFMERYSDRVIFDEVQRVPEIFSLIKLLVDRDRQSYGKFVLTGSSHFSFLKSISESLAGRIGLQSLLPFEYAELPEKARREAIFAGSYPELVVREYTHAANWYSSYIDTYLNKDLRLLANIGDLRDFRRFLQLLATHASQVIDLSHFAKAVGVSVPTIKRWISILEASYVIFLLPPYYQNRGKRVTKSPKLYFFDTGLVSFFTGIETFEQYDLGPMAGALFENYIISEIYKRELHRATHAQLYYMRTYDKSEVDLIVERRGKLEWIEIKKSSTFKSSMIQSLLSLAGDHPKTLIYQGDSETFKGVNYISYRDYLS
ncbi:MAG: hypothetical protein S4CHLAM81_07130 [Chlamydiales bacterium]|nr:hypothetical protein [Chlamydiales bacterium]MCH9635497.1 hypothetical protein [Chlamydiales bacterium]MCH9703660.1 ATP-binding protein [Chlamydiota bacterium]